MLRQLLILRHAKSAWNTEAATDFARPLNKRGERDAPRVGHWLREQSLIPDHVLSSPAERARQTALKVCKELDFPAARVQWEPHIYEATQADLLQVLAGCPAEARRILLVGHNPGLELLVRYLCPSVVLPQDGKLLPTAAVALLEMPDDWRQLAPGSARLATLTRPAAGSDG